MEMHQLRYFVAVAREGNFTRAARSCHVSQPSLSQQIRKLEEELGQSLLHRLKNGKSVLSPAGELFFPRAVRILQETKLAVSELDHISSNVTGTVRLGAIPTLAPYLVPDTVMRFNRDYPQVELVAHETTTAELLAMLWRNELDFALASPPFAGGPWETQHLATEPLLLASLAETPAHAQALADEAEAQTSADEADEVNKSQGATGTNPQSPHATATQKKSRAAKSANAKPSREKSAAQKSLALSAKSRQPSTSSPTAANATAASAANDSAERQHASSAKHTDVVGEHTDLATHAANGLDIAAIKNLTLSDLANESFILMREGHCLTNQIVGFCQQADFKPKVKFLSAQVETLKALIRAGAGISLLPALAIDPTDPTLRYFRLHDKPSPQREIVAFWRADFPLSRASSEFIRYARQTLQKRLGE